MLGVMPHLARIPNVDSGVLNERSDNFAPWMSKLLLFNFWEMKKTNILYARDEIVEKWSAVPNYPGMESVGS